jgi:hypothetical protein
MLIVFVTPFPVPPVTEIPDPACILPTKLKATSEGVMELSTILAESTEFGARFNALYLPVTFPEKSVFVVNTRFPPE